MSDLKSYLDSKNFDGAIEYLKSQAPFEKPIKYYNLGYVHTLKGDFVNARYYLEKAKAEGLINEKVIDSLDYVKGELGVSQIESDYSLIDRGILNISNIKGDAFLVLLSIFPLLFLLGLYRKTRWLTTVSVILFLSLGAVIFTFKDLKTVIVQKEAFVHQGPSRIFDPNQLIVPGAKVIIEAETKDWKFVRFPEVYRGWIYKSKVKKL